MLLHMRAHAAGWVRAGSGKTTLVQCLSLRNRSFEGALRYNGKAPSGEYFTRAGALVRRREPQSIGVWERGRAGRRAC